MPRRHLAHYVQQYVPNAGTPGEGWFMSHWERIEKTTYDTYGVFVFRPSPKWSWAVGATTEMVYPTITLLERGANLRTRIIKDLAGGNLTVLGNSGNLYLRLMRSAYESLRAVLDEGPSQMEQAAATLRALPWTEYDEVWDQLPALSNGRA